MNFNKEDKKIIRRSVVIILISIILYFSIKNLGNVKSFFDFMWNILSPFAIGAMMAFILNILMSNLEKHILSHFNFKKKSVKRAISIILSLLIFFGVLVLLIVLVAPQLVKTIQSIIAKAPTFVEEFTKWFESVDLFKKFTPELEKFVNSIDIANIGNKALNYLSREYQSLLTNAFSTVMGIFNGVFNTFLSLIFAIYCLSSKEKLAKQSKELLYASLDEHVADRVLYVTRVAKKSFHNFFTGQFMEAVLLGLLCFIGMILIKLPFAPLVSVIIGFGALIPVFGAIFAGAIGAIIIAIESPIKALIFLIYLTILQQIDGNFVYPRIVGNQVGLPSMWVLFSITVGGAILGVAGMLIAVPIFSTIYTLLSEYKELKLKEKNLNVNSK